MLKSKLNSSVKRDLSNYLAYNTALGKPATAQAEGKSPQFIESPAQRMRNRNLGYGSSLNQKTREIMENKIQNNLNRSFEPTVNYQ